MPTSMLRHLRGAAVGAVTITVAIAAHGAAGGGLPAGSGLVILLLVGAATGAAAASMRGMPSPRAADRSLLPMLAAGQIASHMVLALALDQHGAAHHAPAAGASVATHGESLPMMLAHAVAIIVAATLIQLGERGCACVTDLIKQVMALLALIAPAAVPELALARAQEPPPLRPRLLDAGLSSRGPPALAFQ
ncbi:hypothetical protein HT102_13220 [Hoyosella sp. G463]|uniref:Uncharacterized protein n=1 Tax=Lolliginicoccus lacisalsi TaxID=2742202 RepID=A0A927JDP0_9ACTN|nr:hypothetical protein [Lolliginicoccus lacisalsi]MBD8507444.1 hypothetical protein [Lolliginicoccus lacisalsi]